MGNYFGSAGQWVGSVMHETWVWLNRLNQQEWIALLIVVAALGFTCMRGFSSRGRV
jgi:hypothetical protein